MKVSIKVDHEELQIGDCVMVRSNEDEPWAIGTLMDWWQHNPESSKIPAIKFDRDGKTYHCMGIVLPYNATLMKMLEPLPFEDQWWILTWMGKEI